MIDTTNITSETNNEETMPVATFKASLKEWQARWKEQRAEVSLDQDVSKRTQCRLLRKRRSNHGS